MNANGRRIHLQSGSFSQTGQFRALRSSSQKSFEVQFVPFVFIHAPFSVIERVKMDAALFSKSHRHLWLNTQRHHSTGLLRVTFNLRGCLSGILKVIKGAFWREQKNRATLPTFFFFVNPFKFKCVFQVQSNSGELNYLRCVKHILALRQLGIQKGGKKLGFSSVRGRNLATLRGLQTTCLLDQLLGPAAILKL